MKVKAAIQYEYHKPLTIEKVELEDPGPHDVMIKMAACAIATAMFIANTANTVSFPCPA